MDEKTSEEWNEQVIAPKGGDVENVARAALKNLHRFTSIVWMAYDASAASHKQSLLLTGFPLMIPSAMRLSNNTLLRR